MRKFSPLCTLPQQTAVYVVAPNVRSTLDIVWNCVSILILCSWSILHLNVPAQYTPRSKSQWIRRLVWLTIRKIKWMLANLVAPEFIVAKALSSFHSARSYYPSLKKLAEKDSVPWSMAHTFLADMGGLVIHFPESCHRCDEASPNCNHLELTPTNPSGWSETIEEFRVKQDIAARKYGNTAWRLHDHNVSLGQASNTSNCMLIGNIWVLDARQLQYARECGIISQLHNITEDEVADKGKGDFAAKALALIQVLWLIIQIAVRTATRKPSSPLEVATLAFATLAFITYIILFNHPQNLTTPFQISAKRVPDLKEFKELICMRRGEFLKMTLGDYSIANNVCLSPSGDTRGLRLFFFGGMISGFIFGNIMDLIFLHHRPVSTSYVRCLIWLDYLDEELRKF
ncbi:hypothetical protein F4806DRAFT_506295 [Annulohypoxylon nitens]|nr:hypothetical protein F4806DRAFT_506295 [Annulohypoxylon nitens]